VMSWSHNPFPRWAQKRSGRSVTDGKGADWVAGMDVGKDGATGGGKAGVGFRGEGVGVRA
jgi:hypothetical protein